MRFFALFRHQMGSKSPYPTLQLFVSYICSLIRLGQVSLYASMLFIPIFVSYICSLIRLGQVRLYAAMLFIPILVSYICSTIRLGQVRLYAAMLFITIFVFGVVFLPLVVTTILGTHRENILGFQQKIQVQNPQLS